MDLTSNEGGLNQPERFYLSFMVILIILTILLVSAGLWSSANEVSIHTEHHEATIDHKKALPAHNGEMMYMYRHGYLGELESPYESPHVNHEVHIKPLDPAGPGILSVQGSHIYHEVDHGEKVTVEIRKVITKHKISKKVSQHHYPVSILKKNGKKIKI